MATLRFLHIVSCHLQTVRVGCCFGGFLFYFVFRPRHAACGILVPRPETEPVPLAVKVQSPNHWTASEFPVRVLFLPFQFGFLLFIFLFWFLWLGLPKLCWIKVVSVFILILFLILKELLSAFQRWVWCCLWQFRYFLRQNRFSVPYHFLWALLEESLIFTFMFKAI